MSNRQRRRQPQYPTGHGLADVSPQTLRDLEHGAIPKGWEVAAKTEGPRTYFGYNATNRCCRRWVLLGWPEINGKPRWLDGSGPTEAGIYQGRLRAACPKCDADLWFDLAHPDLVERRAEHQPPCIVGGVIHNAR